MRWVCDPKTWKSWPLRASTAMKAFQQQQTQPSQGPVQLKWGPFDLTAYLSKDERVGRLQKLAAEIAFEVVLVVVFLKAYNMVRNQFGSQKCTPEFALGHAMQIINLERSLGIFWEQEIQGMVLGWRLWIRFWNIFYGTAHMAVTVFVLGFLFALKPAAYQRCRTIFILMNILAISGYASYPLMPPRLVNSCDDPYGGCAKEFYFVDTLHEIGGFWSWKDKAVSKVSNHYAAMPSMHAGYSIWCSISMYGHSPFAIFRALALVYPLMTLYCIVVTANHYFMDAICGAAALFLATKIAMYMPQIGRGAGSTEGLEGEGWPEKGGLGSKEEELALLLPVSVHPGATGMAGSSPPPGKGMIPSHGSNSKLSNGADSDAGMVQAVHITVGSLQKR